MLHSCIHGANWVRHHPPFSFSSQVLQHALRNPKHEELKIDNCIALHYVMGKSGPEVETTETTPKAPMVSC